MSNCIYPSTMGGGTAYSHSFSAGFGGSPGRSTVKFVNKSGDYSKPRLGTNNVMQVGIAGKTRPQVPVKYSIERTPQSSLLTVIFEDKSIVDLQKTQIFVAPLDFPAPPSTPCVISLGKIYHKDARAPGALTREMAAIPGPSPTYIINGKEKKKFTEFMLFSAAEFAVAIGHLIGDGLRNAIAGLNRYFGADTDAMSLITSLASNYKWELYANDEGKLDLLSASSGAAANITNVGSGCNIVGMTESSDITNNFSQGAYVTYEHEADWKDERTQRFRSIDFLALPLRVCGSGPRGFSLYKPKMDKTDKLHLKRFLKILYLAKTWSDGWDGLQSYIFLKRTAGNGNQQKQAPEKLLADTARSGSHGTDRNKSASSIAVAPANRGGLVKGKLKHVYSNKSVDALFECVKPLEIDLDETEGQIVDSIERAFDKGPQNSKAARLEAVNMNGDKAALIVKSKDANGESDVSDGGGKWAPGRNSEIVQELNLLMSSLGRYWFMTGGGAGGGAGLIKEREHGNRTYLDAKTQWINKDQSVRFGPFSEIYKAIFQPTLNEWEDEGGIIVNKDEVKRGKKELREGARDISISQFLHLVSKLRAVSMSQDAEEGDFVATYEDAFLKGRGKTPEELRKEKEQALEDCGEYEPDGLVILDKEQQGFPVPEQTPALKSLAGGVEPNVDEYGNDIVRGLAEKYETVRLINPSAKNNETEKQKKGIKAEDNKYYDDVDGELDEIGVGSVFDLVGRRVVESFNYVEEFKRKYSNARSISPSCEDKVYKVKMERDELDGRVLRREIDCFGRVKDWDKDWSNADSLAVIGALNARVSELSYVRTADQSTTTIRTCGAEPASMPSTQQGLEGFNVELNADGSVNTSFTVGGVSRAAAFNSNQGNRKGGRNGS